MLGSSSSRGSSPSRSGSRRALGLFKTSKRGLSRRHSSDEVDHEEKLDERNPEERVEEPVARSSQTQAVRRKSEPDRLPTTGWQQRPPGEDGSGGTGSGARSRGSSDVQEEKDEIRETVSAGVEQLEAVPEEEPEAVIAESVTVSYACRRFFECDTRGSSGLLLPSSALYMLRTSICKCDCVQDYIRAVFAV